MMDADDAIHLVTSNILGCSEILTRNDDSNESKAPLVSLYTWSGHPLQVGEYRVDIVSPENLQSSLPFGHHAQTAPAEPLTK